MKLISNNAERFAGTWFNYHVIIASGFQVTYGQLVKKPFIPSHPALQLTMCLPSKLIPACCKIYGINPHASYLAPINV